MVSVGDVMEQVIGCGVSVPRLPVGCDSQRLDELLEGCGGVSASKQGGGHGLEHRGGHTGGVPDGAADADVVGDRAGWGGSALHHKFGAVIVKCEDKSITHML